MRFDQVKKGQKIRVKVDRRGQGTQVVVRSRYTYEGYVVEVGRTSEFNLTFSLASEACRLPMARFIEGESDITSIVLLEDAPLEPGWYLVQWARETRAFYWDGSMWLIGKGGSRVSSAVQTIVPTHKMNPEALS